MEERPIQGNFSTTLFPELLFLIWQRKKTGSLRIKKGEIKKNLNFKKGNIAGELVSFPVNDFLKTLAKKKIINSKQVEKCQGYSCQNKVSIIKSLTELAILSPSHLWQLMETFYKDDFYSLFDWPEAEYYFESGKIPYETHILRENKTLNFILQGIRKMKNYDLIEARLPIESESLEVLNPSYLNQINFESYELYLLKLIENSKNLKSIYDLSEIGKKECQKHIFAFLCLEIVGFPQEKEKTLVSHELSSENLDKILTAFNNRCSYIYKYISKEIGPVALNVLSKSLDDIKSHLGPYFQAVRLKPDGKIDMKSILGMNIKLLKDERWNNFLQGLDEILTAEVLAVKRTLGDSHETVLIENLEKIGELS